MKMTMETKLRRNIWILYCFSFFWLAMVIMPVIVPFFESRGLGLAEVFYLQAAFAGFVVLFEVPSGYIADVYGRRNALLAGSLFHGICFTGLYFAEGFAQLLVVEVMLAVGLSLLSGADLSLLYDSQEALGLSPRDKTRGIANLRVIKSLAEGLSALLGGILIVFQFDVVVLVNAIFAWCPLLLAVWLTEAPFQRMRASAPIENVKAVVMHLFYTDRLLRWTCLGITFFSLSTFYVVWLLQPYWQSLGAPLTVFGLLWAAQSFLFAFASRICQSLELRFGAAPILISIGVLPVVGYLGMAHLGGVVGILVSFTFFVSRGLNQVILTDALNARVPSTFRATANSMASFAFRGIYIVTGPLVGLIVESQGLHFTLTCLGIMSALLAVWILIPLLQEIRGLNRSLIATREAARES